MPIRHRPDFKEALSTLRRLKNAEDQAYCQNWCKALPRLGGNGKIPGGIPHLRHHPATMDLTLMERGNLRKSVNGLFTCGMSSHNEFGAKVTVAKFGNSQRSLLSPTGWCKEKTSYYRKLATKTVSIQKEELQEH